LEAGVCATALSAPQPELPINILTDKMADRNCFSMANLSLVNLVTVVNACGFQSFALQDRMLFGATHPPNRGKKGGFIPAYQQQQLKSSNHPFSPLSGGCCICRICIRLKIIKRRRFMMTGAFRCSHFIILLLTLLCAWLILPVRLVAAEDFVILKNGDKITGEIKLLNKADLQIDPGYGENIFIIDWNEVVHIESAREFIIETDEGKRFIGVVRTDPRSEDQILIQGKNLAVSLKQSHLVFLKPVEEDFWGRLDASVDFGLGLTKSDDAKQLNARLNVAYLTERWSSSARFETLYNDRKEADTTRRFEANADYRRYFSGEWFYFGNANFLQSNELQLALRSTLGGGVGRYLVRNNQWLLSGLGGAAWTKERYEDPTLDIKNSAESFLGLELDIFDIGDLDILTDFKVIPSLTESGRVRMNFNTNFQWELIKDLYFRIGFTNNFDNSPPEGSPKNDYVFNTSVGWSF
jgi:putative salt-induced outer membrane protein YdiY